MREFGIGHALAHRSATMMIHNIVCHIADNQTATITVGQEV